MAGTGMSDSDDFYRSGSEDQANDPDSHTSIAQVVQALRDEEARARDALMELRRVAGDPYALVGFRPHTLIRNGSHAHHLRIVSEKRRKGWLPDSERQVKWRVEITEFEAVCQVCQGVDKWATLERLHAEAADYDEEKHEKRLIALLTGTARSGHAVKPEEFRRRVEALRRTGSYSEAAGELGLKDGPFCAWCKTNEAAIRLSWPQFSYQSLTKRHKARMADRVAA